MIRLLLDTNLLIQEPDFSLLDAPADEIELYTSALCYAELLEGEFSTDPLVAASAIMQYAATQAALGEGLPFGSAELSAYRALCAAVVRSGRGITRARRMDTMIAATALSNGMTLATRNRNDFAAIQKIMPIVQL